MTERSVADTFEQGTPYERYMGRWSRAAAPARTARAWAIRGTVAA